MRESYEPEHDAYAVLGVKPEAGGEEIRRAYLGKARLVHPDRHGGNDPCATEEMRRLTGAYERLHDPARRAQYDAARAAYHGTSASSWGRAVPEEPRVRETEDPWSEAARRCEEVVRAQRARRNAALTRRGDPAALVERFVHIWLESTAELEAKRGNFGQAFLCVGLDLLVTGAGAGARETSPRTRRRSRKRQG